MIRILMLFLMIYMIGVQPVFAAEEQKGNKVITIAPETEDMNTVFRRISSSTDQSGWTIEMKSGVYSSFTIPETVENLTIRAAKNSVPVIDVFNERLETKTADIPDTGGVLMKNKGTLLFEGIEFRMNAFDGPWYTAALSSYNEAECSPESVTLRSCRFTGSGVRQGTAVYFMEGIQQILIERCTFANLKTGVQVYNTNQPVEAIIRNCMFVQVNKPFSLSLYGNDQSSVLVSKNIIQEGQEGTIEINGGSKAPVIDFQENDFYDLNLFFRNYTQISGVYLREKNRMMRNSLIRMQQDSLDMEPVETQDLYWFGVDKNRGGKWMFTGESIKETAALEQQIDQANLQGSAELLLSSEQGMMDDLVRFIHWEDPVRLIVSYLDDQGNFLREGQILTLYDETDLSNYRFIYEGEPVDFVYERKEEIDGYQQIVSSGFDCGEKVNTWGTGCIRLRLIYQKNS